MSLHGPVVRDIFDDFIISKIIPVRDAVKLSEEELDVLRANIRSEILYSDKVREVLVAKSQEVMAELRK